MTRAENHTEYPARDVRRLVRWACRDVGLDECVPSGHVLVRVRHHGGAHPYQGRCYWDVSRYRGGPISVPDGVRHLLVCRLPHLGACEYPAVHDRGLRGGPPPITVNGWEESLVAIVAHEATHLRQFATVTDRSSKGRPRVSEVECEWAEFRALVRFRRRRGVV
jgi:hypothetical protein